MNPDLLTEAELEIIRPKRFPFIYALAGLGFIALVSLALLYVILMFQNSPPASFPIGQRVDIAPGMNVRDIANALAEAGVVRSSSLLYFVIVLSHEPRDIKASSYLFDSPLSTTEVAKRLVVGDFDTDLIRFTHFEGERLTSIAMRAAEILPAFNADEFITITAGKEGRLFPETYFVPATFTAAELAALMESTFVESLAPLATDIKNHPLTLDKIIVLASIIEREANTTESKRMVSGILQNRLAIDMPLQADASIEYALDKPLKELTPEDLEIDTPYNTYLYKGLPPTPIGNPGLDAIQAVLKPQESEYFYYITDEDGVFYYAETYDEHLDNIERYLR